jgi:hypothetical protein
MRNTIILIVIAILLFGCNAQKQALKNGKTYDNFRGFEPIDPIEYDDNVYIVIDDSIVSKEMKLLSPEEILSFLNNETVLVSIGQFSMEGGISYLPVTVSAKYTSYRVTMDYMKFATLGQRNQQNEFIGFKRVGVGLRLISLITTTDAGINIGDLSSIGMAAKMGKLTGTLMVEVIGIKSKEVTTLLPLPSEINQTTIQNAMQALAAIKSKIYDNDTKLYPQVMAIKTIESNIDTVKTSQNRIDSINENNRIKLQIDNNKIIPASKVEKAEDLERQAFNFLFEKDIENAIMKFNECNNTFPSYHSVYEILRLLRKEKANLVADNDIKWKEVYSKILKDYNWKLSNETLKKLRDLSQ